MNWQALAISLVSMMAGATLVHEIYKPDLRIPLSAEDATTSSPDPVTRG
jgi:hypothetical protein